MDEVQVLASNPAIIAWRFRKINTPFFGVFVGVLAVSRPLVTELSFLSRNKLSQKIPTVENDVLDFIDGPLEYCWRDVMPIQLGYHQLRANMARW